MKPVSALTCLKGNIIRAALMGLVLQFSAANSAQAGTEYFALDNAAIVIKNPEAAPLVAITRAGQRLLAVGLHGVIIYSQDNGFSWKQALVPVDLTLTGIYFSSPQQGWAVGHYGVVLHTSDGGLTWSKCLDGRDVITKLDISAKQAQLESVSASDTALKQRVANAFDQAGPSKPFLAIGRCAGGILAAGQQDMTMYSADGGITWSEWTSKISNPNFDDIYDIRNDGAVTYLIGEDGLVLRSTAGCENFQPVPGPYSATLFGGVVLNSAGLIFFGLQGEIFKSDSGGAAWTSMPVSSDAVFVAGLPLRSGQVLLATLGGNLFLSDDKAENFRQISTVIPFQIASMTVAPNGNVVIAGNGGIQILPATSIQ